MFALEHSKAAYWTDFFIYLAVVGGLALCIGVLAPRTDRAAMLALAATGLAGWSLIEYAMHRFVLHRIEPFKTWHASHHARPTALISAPTVLSATLITSLVFIPTLVASTVWSAVSLTLGVTTGYLGYAVCHHATHHWRASGTWLKERKRWHAIHHRRSGSECYGVTSMLWDRVFRTGPDRRLPSSTSSVSARSSASRGSNEGRQDVSSAR